MWELNAVWIMLSREGLWNNLPWKSLRGLERNPSRRSSYVLFPLFSPSCRALENPEKMHLVLNLRISKKDWLIRNSCYPRNFLLNFFWIRQCNQCQTDSKKNWFSSDLISENNVELARYACSIWNIQKIVLRYLPQMSRRPIKSLFHCHQEIVGKRSRLNFQRFHQMLNWALICLHVLWFLCLATGELHFIRSNCKMCLDNDGKLISFH